MALSRSLRLSLAALAAFALLAVPPVAEAKLTIDAARQKADTFAQQTCERDKSCVASGVLNCRRHSRNIAFCRIFDRRATEAQGRFVCNRLVRLAQAPHLSRVKVTGLGRWHC